MTINPMMWDDEDFVLLGDKSKLLWCHLLTGYSGGVPGLIHQAAGAFSGAMRWGDPATGQALGELVEIKFIEFDAAKRLLRIPSRPKYVPCTNGNVLKGWLRRWKDLPASPLKYRHVASLRAGILERAWFQSAWAETFGLIKIPESSRQVPLFHLGASTGTKVPETNNQTLSKNTNNIEGEETTRLPFPDPIPRLNINLSPSTTTLNPLPSIHIRSDAFAALADEIWQEQEDACAALRNEEGCEGRALGLTNPAKVELIHRISERGEDLVSAAEDCRHVLAVLLAEAAAKKTTKWIDGAHWESRRFNMALARAIGDTEKKSTSDVTVGRVEPMDFGEYPEPGAKDW